MEFDDQKAIEFILSRLPADVSARYDDDMIQYFLDTLFDFYEDNGMLDIDFGDDDLEEAEARERQQTIDGLVKILSRDKFYDFRAADIPLLLDAETAYEQTLDD